MAAVADVTTLTGVTVVDASMSPSPSHSKSTNMEKKKTNLMTSHARERRAISEDWLTVLICFASGSLGPSLPANEIFHPVVVVGDRSSG